MKKGKNQFLDNAFWFLPLGLFLFQLIFTIHSTIQIRFEELMESVTAVWWFDNHSVFYGAYTNVGWYAVLLLIYKVFGFGLFTAKFYRLFLWLVSLFCLASLLRKYLGVKSAYIPLVVIALSPTLLYFNTLQAQFGIDLQYFPICLYLIESGGFLRQIFGWFAAVVAWASYPVFVYYLPVLGAVFAHTTHWSNGTNRTYKKFGNFLRFSSSRTRTVGLTTYRHWLVAAVAFVAPVVLVTAYIKNRQYLWFDPITKNGIFRGAGSFTTNVDFGKNISGLFGDLFNRGQSYYFEVAKGEFSMVFPIITVAVVLTGGVYLFKFKKYRTILIFIWLLFFSNLIMGFFSSDGSGLPGIRRYTGVLAAIYAMYVLVWHFVFVEFKFRERLFRSLLLVILLFLPIHHLLVFPDNLAHLSYPSRFSEKNWFVQEATPQKSLERMVEFAKAQDLNLACVDRDGKQIDCRVSEIYAAVSGYCRWNGVSCHKINIYDPVSKQLIELSVDKWNRYEFNH